MAFNPLEQKGMPLEKQLRNWSQLNVQPYDKNTVDPYTRCRIITLNGAEFESMWFSHHFARHCPYIEIKRDLALTRRIEQQQQKAINWLIPASESTLERTIGYEQVAVDLTAFLARMEPDPYLKQAFEFSLLEDFDHLYRYADLMDLLEGKKAEKIVRELTEIMPGRPTVVEHRHPYDDVRRAMNAGTANPLSTLHVLTLVAAEQQTLNFYMNVGNIPENPLARGLYLEIAQIEEQHVTHYESLLDPSSSWFKQDVLHQYNECYLYHSFMLQETDPRIQRLWEIHLDMELEHLRLACERLQKYEKRDPAEFLPETLPEPVVFESNKTYIREVLANQIQLTADLDSFVPVESLPKDHRYFWYQQAVNGNGFVPSEQVIKDSIRAKGTDYRWEIQGPHPVSRLRQGPPQTREEWMRQR
jgi:hypothetical protein